MTGSRLYVVYNRSCGHVAGIHPGRETCELMVSALIGRGRFDWRVRIHQPGDIEAVISGARCESCALDGAATS